MDENVSIEEADIFMSIDIAINFINDAIKEIVKNDDTTHALWMMENAIILLTPWTEVLTDPSE